MGRTIRRSDTKHTNSRTKNHKRHDSFALQPSLPTQPHVIKLNPRDKHEFLDFNRFGSLDTESESSSLTSSSSTSSSYHSQTSLLSSSGKSAVTQDDFRHTHILQLIEEYERLHPTSAIDDNDYDAEEGVILTPLNLTSQSTKAKKKGKTAPDEDEERESFATIYTGTNFKQLNRDYKDFIKNSTESTLTLDAMPAVCRKFAHELAQMYQLKTYSVLIPKKDRTEDLLDKYIVVERVKGKSRMPGDLKALDKLIAQAMKAMSWYCRRGTFECNNGKRDWKPASRRNYDDSKGKGSKSKEAIPSNNLAKPRCGSVVGVGADPLDDSNIGMQMLKKLGWKEGDGLGGSQSGIKDPVTAVVRKKRSGL